MIETPADRNDYQENRMHKDTLFKRLFGDERFKENTMSLYNALGGNCSDPEELIFTTVEGAIYMGRKNDVSFLVDGELMLWEHQSTRNPNMPLRGLIYLAQLYTKYLDLFDLSEYSSRRLSLPSPRYYVFYAGPADAPDREELRLTDLFRNGAQGSCVELTATVLNINEGHNAELHKACKTLADYAHFVALTRAYAKQGLSRAEAVHYAVLTCIDEGVLEPFLRQYRAEVIPMFLEEWDEEKYRDLLRREAEEDGYAAGKAIGMEAGKEAGIKVGLQQGLKQGLEQGLEQGEEKQRKAFLLRASELVRSGSLGLEEAARIFGFDAEEISANL